MYNINQIYNMLLCGVIKEFKLGGNVASYTYSLSKNPKFQIHSDSGSEWNLINFGNDMDWVPYFHKETLNENKSGI